MGGMTVEEGTVGPDEKTYRNIKSGPVGVRR